MDGRRFDTLARTLSASGTRRSALAALLAGTLGLVGLSQPAAGRKRRGGGGVTIEGPCGDGSGPANACDRHSDCCTGICQRTGRGKPKRCRCRRQGQDCTETINCCQGSQDLVCDGGTCQPPCASDSGATGCCDGVTCQIGQYDACGTAGGTCSNCAAASGLNCTPTPSRCQCQPGRGCCIASGHPPLPASCSACCSGDCIIPGEPGNPCAS